MAFKDYIQKALRILGYFFLVIFIVLLMGMVAEKEKKQTCRAIIPHILDSLQIRFVTGKEIRNLLLSTEGNILGKSLREINTEKIEKDLLRHPYIRRAEAYKDVTGNLHIDIVQRKPIVRIYRPGHKGFFLDDQGYILPFSTKFPVRILVASGNISVPDETLSYKTIQNLPGSNRLHEIYRLALFINSNPLWKAQMEQLYINAEGEYTLTPRVGSHAIILGNFQGYERKFKKLYAFYTHGLNNLGWNRYTTINLKYKDQVVCTGR